MTDEWHEGIPAGISSFGNPGRNSETLFHVQTGLETSSSEPHAYTGPNRLTAFVGLSMPAAESKLSDLDTRSTQ